jgi:ribosome modulation factor
MVLQGWIMTPYQKGWFACKAGKLKNENPYELGTEECSEWILGWNNCFDEGSK